MQSIRIAQFFKLTTSDEKVYRYQNYFINETRPYLGESYDFAPFQAEGALASLQGENQQLRVLFPALEIVIRFVEQADGNRMSALQLTTAWITGADAIANTVDDYFIGTGASFNDETVELRFRSSMDSVGATFPARTFTSDNVGNLPLSAELYLR
jgi:phage-related protein